MEQAEQTAERPLSAPDAVGVPAVASAAAPALTDDAQSAAVSANDAATSDVDVEDAAASSPPCARAWRRSLPRCLPTISRSTTRSTSTKRRRSWARRRRTRSRARRRTGMWGRRMQPRILDAVNSPRDLKVLTENELAILADEVRQEIVAVTSRTGGHVASSLGAVEIILALHSLLDCPKDKIVFDVGHQAYAHKLVTGRREEFKTLRQYQGLSGFTKPAESPYDVHCSGHASDSLSIALGLAKARALKGTDEKIVAVIGDASLAGGMAFEALNAIGQAQLPLVIILNDNEMSISRNVGALMKHLGFIRATKEYRETRDHVQDFLEQHGKLGEGMVNFGRSMKDSLKQFVVPNAMIFEQLGIVCTAPIDGHNIHTLRETLSSVLRADGPVLVHVVTKKGHGYGPAEADPETFHGVGPYDIPTGKQLKKSGGAPSYTNVFGEALVREAEANPDVVGITAAMKGGTGLTKLGERFPDRCIDAGIAEENAVGMAAGLAVGGKKPVVAIYSTFMQRAIDQIDHRQRHH